MTRLTDVLKPESKASSKNNFDQYLWSYRFKDYLVMILMRNRGYFSRKVFNLAYELLEISFLAFFCHPDFYASLLFIPFSSFFMNLIVEEVFSLNRSAIFDNSFISKWVNYSLIAIIFLPFVIFTLYVAGDILGQHWILMTIFCSRIILLALQAFSFAYSLEVISKKRVYFSPLNWWLGIVFAVTSIFLLSFGLQIESAVTLGIIAIYLSRLIIELKFVLTIKKLLIKKIKRPSLPSFELKYFILRFSTFAMNVMTLFYASSLLKEDEKHYIWVTFFYLIFLFRLLNRPFRALQLDFIKYFSLHQIEWIHFRHVQTVLLNMTVISTFIIWFAWSNEDWNIVLPFLLLAFNLNLFLCLSSVGQDKKVSPTYLCIRVVGVIGYFFTPASIHLAVFCLSEIILFFVLKFECINFDNKYKYLKESKLLSSKRYSSFEYLDQIKDHKGQYALLIFNQNTREHLKKMFLSNDLIKPLIITKTQWVIPIHSEQDHFELWKMYPRELRRLLLLSKNELNKYLPMSANKLFHDPRPMKQFKKVNNRWTIDGKRVDDSGILKLFAEIEFKSATALCLSDRKFSYGHEGIFFYPLLNLGEVSTIIQMDFYDQKMLNFVKDKSWHTLKSYLFS